MTETYEKPYLRKLETGLMNKFGSRYRQPVTADVDGVTIADLVDAHGSPLFVFSEKKLRESYREIHTAFASRYPNIQFSWSYKTNYLDAICAILHDEGESAEVVSPFEYEKARRLGVPGDRIIFNGPLKPVPALERAAREGAAIHVDHFEEIFDLEEVAAKLGRKLPIGLRLNMDTGIAPLWSRFGFNLESGEALDAVRRIRSGGRLILDGLHCHIGTYIMEPSAYAVEVEKMVGFARRVEEECGFDVEYFDLGGGLPSRARLKGVYLPPEVALPSVDDYAEAICDSLLKHLKPGRFPKVILETGRAVVDEAGSLVSTVHAVKRLPDGKKGYVIDAGLNVLFTSFWYRHRIALEREIAGSFEDCVIYGPMCMNIDVIEEKARLPALPRGMRLVISPVGAYNNTQWMQFISYRPAVVLVGEKGEVDVIRAAETLDDVTGPERLPDRLKPDRAD
jgi:diaminopimelate decarboxylase